MPSLRACWIRFLVKHIWGRKCRRAGRSIDAWRAMEEPLIRNQRPPRGTRVSAVSAGGIAAEWVTGPGASADTTVVCLHGGGFIMGSPAAHREIVARISTASGSRALSVDYRLVPEHPFPAAVEDVTRAYRWLLDQGEEPSRIALGGESAGGGLALQALLSMRDEGTALPRAAFFLSPVTDWVSLDGDSYSSRATLDPMVTPDQCRFTSSLYVGANPAETPLLRPAEMDLSGLPPMWIQAGDHEILLSDAERLARRATEAGVEVDFKVWPGMWHVFQAAAMVVPEGKTSIEELGRFIRRHLS